MTNDPWIEGETILYRLYDVGYEIRLEQASTLLASSAPERRQPTRGEAQAIQIANPPVTVSLGRESWMLGGKTRDVELSARLFDFGVISLRARVLSGRVRWSEFVACGIAIGTGRPWESFDPARKSLEERMAPSIERRTQARVTEEYVIFRLHRVEDDGGRDVLPRELPDEDVARLLVGESRPITLAARKELLSERLSYFDDDVTVLTWSAALVVEPTVEDTDVQYVLEFANAQLLELRYYDTILDAELPRINDEIADARRGFHVLGRRYSRLLAALQTRVADATEAVERVENSLKVTDDVFLARIYAAALHIFRDHVWRSGIDRKVSIVRGVYEMLNAETQARRTEILEIVIILLITVELILALRHG
jgi:hypothetical protein